MSHMFVDIIKVFIL